MPPSIRVLIADDEQSARLKLRKLLQVWPELDVVAEAENGAQAKHLIETCSPNIVFMDISMPEKSGMEVIQEVENRDYQLVFVTAYNNYAVEAFETHAIDYLLKPVKAERLEDCLNKIKDLNWVAPNLPQIPFTESDHGGKPVQLGIRHGTATRIVDANHIGWMEAVHGYCRIHLNPAGQKLQRQKTLITDASLALTHNMLPQDQFLRIHRSHVVNVEQIVSHWSEKRQMYVRLQDFDDEKLPVARRKAASIRARWPAL